MNHNRIPEVGSIESPFKDIDPVANYIENQFSEQQTPKQEEVLNQSQNLNESVPARQISGKNHGSFTG